MELIKHLFDQSKDIYRAIEKVITYNAAQERRLKAEISEYVVTDRIEDQFEKLLSKMQLAMESGGENEVGVWVSGFYGSGKSSFTKYLGFAFNDEAQIDGVPFVRHMQDRLHTPQARALLGTVVKQFPAAVVMLDLASEMLAGATMEDVSTVLYYKVLQWAGYSRNLKVAAFERKIKKDGREEAFKQHVREHFGVEWAVIQNDPLAIDSLLPEIAHQIYPEWFKTPTAFSTETGDFFQFEKDRVQEMLDIVREAKGKEFILFIIDEVGQYVGSRPNLILNLDGLAKNLKHHGGGKAWIIGTAQQTLTQDDPRAALNSPELFKLKDRFPIQIDLEARDIKEICIKRLLGKSPRGATLLEQRFEQCGQALRHHAKLQDAKYYDSDVTKESFVNLYPFLPAHFDILLNLLSALAKSTGGIGLRSAIKVIQDILIETGDGASVNSPPGRGSGWVAGSGDGLRLKNPPLPLPGGESVAFGEGLPLPMAEQELGCLATTVTLYDALEKDIRSAFPSLQRAVEHVGLGFRDTQLHHAIAKTVAVLQILGNLPVTIQNVASLMHPAIDAPSMRAEVEQAVNDLIQDAQTPFGEQDGNLRFFSEKVNEIERERAQIPLKLIETRRIFNETVKELFNPLPSARLHGTLAVTAGVKIQSGTFAASLAGERETMQLVMEMVEPNEYETARIRLADESRQRSAQAAIFLIGRTTPEFDFKSADIYRSKMIAEKYSRDPDAEVKEYCRAQLDRIAKLGAELQRLILRGLAGGSFIFRGQTTAVDSLASDVMESCKKQVGAAAAQVFDRYAEAPVRADTTLSEKFLRAWPKGITSAIDPLGLVQMQGGKVALATDHKALQSLRDYLVRHGAEEGKRLSEHFTDAPFGWSPDTLRYLVAALFVAGVIKLKVSGRDITTNGQQALDALKNNNSFKTVGLALRETFIKPEDAARAAERLTDLIGEQIVPLEDEICKTAIKYLPQFQTRYAPLGEKLAALDLPGVERIHSLQQEIADLLFADASDAPQRLGSEESALYNHLKWANDVDIAFKHGVEKTIRAMQQHCRDIAALPASGVPGQLRDELKDELAYAQERLGKEDFYRHAPDLNTTLTTMQSRARDAAASMAQAQQQTLRDAQQALTECAEWAEFTQQEQSDIFAQIERLQIEAPHDLPGLKRLVNQEFVIHSEVGTIRQNLLREGQERRRKREEAEAAKQKDMPLGKEGAQTETRTIAIPARLRNKEQIEALIRQLQELNSAYGEIDVTVTIATTTDLTGV